MALVFDGNGRVVIPTWTPAVQDDFTMEFTYKHSGTFAKHFLATNGDSTRRVYQGTLTGRPLTIQMRGTGGQIYDYSLASATDIYAGTDVYKTVFVVTPGSAAVYVNDSATPREPATAIALTANLDTWQVDVLGSISSTGASVAGMELHEARLIDPNTTGGLNDSVYLFNETTGTNVPDTGGRAANGTLTGFLDPNAAWTQPAVPTARKGTNLSVTHSLPGTGMIHYPVRQHLDGKRLGMQ